MEYDRKYLHELRGKLVFGDQRRIADKVGTTPGYVRQILHGTVKLQSDKAKLVVSEAEGLVYDRALDVVTRLIAGLSEEVRTRFVSDVERLRPVG